MPDPAPLGAAAIDELLGLSLGISAWKRQGEVLCPVRCCPSSGNLPPTEPYLIFPPRLEAEAARLQGTGIGCFFDDALHELLGIGDQRFQVVDQLTLGKAVVDTRFIQEVAYPGRRT